MKKKCIKSFIGFVKDTFEAIPSDACALHILDIFPQGAREKRGCNSLAGNHFGFILAHVLIIKSGFRLAAKSSHSLSRSGIWTGHCLP